MCGWLDCYISLFRIAKSAGNLNLPFRDSKRKVACRLGKVKLSCGFQEFGWRYPSIPSPQLRFFLSVREGREATSLWVSGDIPPSSPPPFIFNHCATMQSYTQARVYEYTSIQYHLFSKYVKLWRRRRSNTVPRSQITMYGALCFCS